MSRFFLLPTDLQIHVLHDWLSLSADNGLSLLSVLSSLDMACGRSDQPAFRSLVSQLPAFGAYHHEAWLEYRNSKLVSNCCLWGKMHWLSSRKVPVQSLMSGPAGFRIERLTTPKMVISRLPTVETVLWPYDEIVLIVDLCPNLTSLTLDRSIDLAPSIIALLPKLTAVIMPGHANLQSISFLDCIGNQLLKLHVRDCVLGSELAAQIGNTCPNLQQLAVTVHEIGELLMVLRSCTYLHDLKLLVKSLDISALKQILGDDHHGSKQQVKRLKVSTTEHFGDGPNAETFATMLVFRPDIAYLQVGPECKYNAVESKLSVRLLDEDDRDEKRLFRRILAVCFSVTCVETGYISEDSASAIVETCAGRLEVLKLEDLRHLNIVLDSCGPTMKHINCSGEVSDAILRQIATKCPQLESLELSRISHNSSASDDGMVAIIEACQNLKALKIYAMHPPLISGKFLECVVNRKKPLERVEVRQGGFWEFPVQLRQQLKEHQILPVPRIVVRGRCYLLVHANRLHCWLQLFDWACEFLN